MNHFFPRNSRLIRQQIINHYDLHVNRLKIGTYMVVTVLSGNMASAITYHLMIRKSL